MSLLSIARWVQSTEFFTALRGSSDVYPIVMTLHLVGIAMFGGMVLFTDLRLLGLAMSRRSISDLVDQLRAPKRIGLIIVMVCGILMLGSKAEEYYYNVFFRTKMVLLALVFVHGWVFHRGVYGNAAALDQAPRIPLQAKVAACLSLILWSGLVIAGRGIGYIEPPLDKIHAQLELPAGLFMRLIW
jgi:hypothetical protein